jgi:quinol monooxygenase YgiN
MCQLFGAVTSFPMEKGWDREFTWRHASVKLAGFDGEKRRAQLVWSKLIQAREEDVRKSMIALVAFATSMVSAQAQTPKPAMGSDQIYWVITFTVDQMDKFKPIVQKLVAATEKEPGTLEYEYAVGDDQKTVDVFERYTNSHAAVVHVTENFGPNFSKDFLAVAKPSRFVVYGVPTDELKKTLADFKPVYMTPFDGFTK